MKEWWNTWRRGATASPFPHPSYKQSSFTSVCSGCELICMCNGHKGTLASSTDVCESALHFCTWVMGCLSYPPSRCTFQCLFSNVRNRLICGDILCIHGGGGAFNHEGLQYLPYPLICGLFRAVVPKRLVPLPRVPQAPPPVGSLCWLSDCKLFGAWLCPDLCSLYSATHDNGAV